MHGENNIKFIKTSLYAGVHNPERQVAMATKFHTVAPNICGSSVRNLLHVTLLAPRSLRWLLHFFKKFCSPLFICVK